MAIKVEISEFKGYPVIQFFDKDGPYPLKAEMSFGVRKAGLILSNIDKIKKFYDDNKKEETTKI